MHLISLFHPLRLHRDYSCYLHDAFRIYDQSVGGLVALWVMQVPGVTRKKNSVCMHALNNKRQHMWFCCLDLDFINCPHRGQHYSSGTLNLWATLLVHKCGWTLMWARHRGLSTCFILLSPVFMYDPQLVPSVYTVIRLRDHGSFCALVLLTCWTKQCRPDVAVRHSELFSHSLKAEAADSRQQVRVH